MKMKTRWLTIQMKLQTYDLMSPQPFISVSDIKRGGRGRGGMSPEQPLPSEAFIASSMKSSTVVCNAIFNS